MLASATACSDAVARTLASVPVPAGAVLVEEEHSFQGERGAHATRTYSLPSPIDEACPPVIGPILGAGYRLDDYSPPHPRIEDATTWCTTAINAQRAANGPDSLVAIVAQAYAPGADEESPFGVALTPPSSTDPYPAGTLLRLESS